jgi:hypothetical protein
MRVGLYAGLVVFVLAVVSLVAVPSLRARPTAREIRVELMRELQPVVLSNCTLRRIGGPHDGGYLLCSNLLGDVKSAYSYGIGPADDWGCQISQTYGVPVHQYDCFSPPHESCASGRSVFHNECVGPRAETIDGKPFDTLVSQTARNGDAGKNLVVKIDIEGAELDSILATPARYFDKVDQLAMEIHGTDARFLQLVRRLKRRFHLVHVHFNNQACGVRYRPLPAWAYQVLLVNRRIGVVDPANPRPVLPNPLDAPDFALGHDCQVAPE